MLGQSRKPRSKTKSLRHSAGRRSARSSRPARGGWRSRLIAPTIILLGLVVGYPIVKAIYQSFLTDKGLTPTGFFDAG